MLSLLWEHTAVAVLVGGNGVGKGEGDCMDRHSGPRGGGVDALTTLKKSGEEDEHEEDEGIGNRAADECFGEKMDAPVPVS